MIHMGLRTAIYIGFHVSFPWDRPILDSHTALDERNRVRLTHETSGPGADYINASFLEVGTCNGHIVLT